MSEPQSKIDRTNLWLLLRYSSANSSKTTKSSKELSLIHVMTPSYTICTGNIIGLSCESIINYNTLVGQQCLTWASNTCQQRRIHIRYYPTRQYILSNLSCYLGSWTLRHCTYRTNHRAWSAGIAWKMPCQGYQIEMGLPGRTAHGQSQQTYLLNAEVIKTINNNNNNINSKNDHTIQFASPYKKNICMNLDLIG